MFSVSGHWTCRFFIEAGELFLRIMNERWKVAETEANAIAKLLRKHGLEKGKVLDLMCGNGRISINLAKLGYKVVGIDISPMYIEDARGRAKEHNVAEDVKFLVGDECMFCQNSELCIQRSSNKNISTKNLGKIWQPHSSSRK